MTVAEFAGCSFLAFGPPLSLFLFTIAIDPVRIIVMIAAAFVWLVALLGSSLFWFALRPMGAPIVVGVVISVAIQELFRFGIYKLLRRTKDDLHRVAQDSTITDNKHTLAYVAGLGFGVMSGAFALVNILADTTGPGTMGLLGGSQTFFVTSAAQTLCMILLHTCWGVIFFEACDRRSRALCAVVVLGHLTVALLTQLNRWELYAVTLLGSWAVLVATAAVAAKVAGATRESWVRFVKCQ